MAEHVLHLDLETYSSVNLLKSGVYRYAEAPDFQVLLFAYAFETDTVQVLDLTRQELPEYLCKALTDPTVIKMAYNAQFERVCLSRYLGMDGYLPPEQWHCTMIHAATMGLPRSLEDVGRVLGLSEDKAKLKTGKELIRYFCSPCKPTKANGGRTRNLPCHAPEKWESFMTYCGRDVETERTIGDILSEYPVPVDEWLAYAMDQRINDRGVLVDMKLVRAAIDMNREHAGELTGEAEEITGLENVNSVGQLKGWLGVEGSLDKEAVAAMRAGGTLDEDSDRVLAIRQELGKTSVSKYEAMERGVCRDGRVRGLFAFYGANRTGRWAGRQVQVQNLPQNHIPDLTQARNVVLDGDRDALQALYGSVPAVLSELIRTAFIAKPGHTFVVCDFSAIEARVIAWLADEDWRKQVFAEGKDIYCASASKMFRVPVEKHGVNGHLRQKGKIAELALGYGGSVGAMKNMGALKMGLTEDELPGIVTAWRASNPRIVELWWQIDRAARDTISNCLTLWRTDLPHGLSMKASNKLMHIRLPSGRSLRYWKPRLTPDDMGRENISYGGMDAGRWGRVFSYGPKLVENIVQGIARDCLRDAMLAVSLRYPGIVMHVHDEMIVEVPEDEAQVALGAILDVMKRPVPWAPGLNLKGDGYITPFYKKD